MTIGSTHLAAHPLYPLILELWQLRDESETTVSLDSLQTTLELIQELFAEYSTIMCTMAVFSAQLTENSPDRWVVSMVVVLVHQIIDNCSSRSKLYAIGKRDIASFSNLCNSPQRAVVQCNGEPQALTTNHIHVQYSIVKISCNTDSVHQNATNFSGKLNMVPLDIHYGFAHTSAVPTIKYASEITQVAPTSIQHLSQSVLSISSNADSPESLSSVSTLGYPSQPHGGNAKIKEIGVAKPAKKFKHCKDSPVSDILRTKQNPASVTKTILIVKGSALKNTGLKSRLPRPNHSVEVQSYLKDWITKHKAHPYPSEEAKQAMCLHTGLELIQLNNWFINVFVTMQLEGGISSNLYVF
ncbi:hypothetical protein MT418_002127 [Batrachochytrium dendrobatidis]